MRVSVSNVVVLLVAIAIGYTGRGSVYTVQTQTVYDTLAAQDARNRVIRERLRSDGWRARFESIEQRAPDTVFHVDTLVPPPDTIIEFVQVRGGTLTTGFLTVRDSLYAPTLHVGTDISDCDEGFDVSASGVVCDRATFGHLYVGPWLNNTDPIIAAWWTPSYRSPWEAWIGYGTRWHFGARYGLRLF